MPPEFSQIIDHPIQPGWLAHGRDIYLDPTHRKMIGERFKETGEDIEVLLGAMALAGAITDSERMRHESESRGDLRLDQNHRLHVYTELAGKPDEIGKYINWFSQVGQDCFDHAETRSDLKEIGSDLWGMRQAGDWSGTGPIDDAAETIQDKLLEVNPAAIVRILKRGSGVGKSYFVTPLGHVANSQYNPEFKHAIISRKRAAAKIIIPGKNPMHVYKRSFALAVIDQLDEEDKAIFRAAYRNYDNFEDNLKKNSTPAGVLGREFEKAIHPKVRSKSRRIIPISAHYFVAMSLPEEMQPAA